MELIFLNPLDLSIAALLVVALAALSWRLHLEVGKQLLIAALRSVIQLTLLGIVLKILFAQSNPLLLAALALFMLAAASYEIIARQKRRFRGLKGIGIGSLSMFISSFSMTLLALHVVVQVKPWYAPQYSIPLLGMLLGNVMSGIAIALNTLTQSVWQQRGEIEAQLSLGHSWHQAIAAIRRSALHAGMIPIINAVATAGVVSLPGMMTGQILAGSPPLEAAKYQIMILLLIMTGTGLGSITAVWLGSRHLFDERQRLRLERIQ